MSCCRLLKDRALDQSVESDELSGPVQDFHNES